MCNFTWRKIFRRTFKLPSQVIKENLIYDLNFRERQKFILLTKIIDFNFNNKKKKKIHIRNHNLLFVRIILSVFSGWKNFFIVNFVTDIEEKIFNWIAQEL